MGSAVEAGMAKHASRWFLKVMFAAAGVYLATGVTGLGFVAVTGEPGGPVFAMGTTSAVWCLGLTYVAWCGQKRLATAKEEAERLRQRIADLEARVAELTKA
ncbi:MAG: hypothetical protein FJX75_06555 [Armatimonadetes bacterium]|nr:hypothetical protein [Armatimonadota bacterium]